MPKTSVLLTTGGICLLAALLCVVIGWLRTGDPGPLDNKSLSLLSAGTMDRPCLANPHEHQLFDVTDQQARSLVEALHPIRSVKVGGLPPEAVDFTFYFQPGMDPVIFHMHLDNGQLIYTERQYLYEGGDAKAFKQIADVIMATNRGKPGVIVEAKMDKGSEALPSDGKKRDSGDTSQH